MTRKRAKPVRAWAVFSPAGELLLWTINETSKDAWGRLVITPGDRANARKDGYRIARVTVTEDIP